MKVANILSIPIEIEIPIVMLEDFEEITLNNTPIEPASYQINTFTNKKSPEELIDKFIYNTEKISSQFYTITAEDRVKKIKELLRLDHLNQKELERVNKLITKHSDRFQMPDEPLEPTNAAMYSIPTIDEQPIFSKQYRFPPAHKEEITKEVNESFKK